MTQDEPALLLYVHGSDELYGSDIALLELVRGLDAARFRALVVLPTDLPYEGRLTSALQQRGVPVIHLPLAIVRRRYLTLPGAARYAAALATSTLRLVRLIQRHQVTFVHSNTIAVWPGALAARLTRRPHVWHLHELLAGPPVARRALGLLLRSLATTVVANSRAARASLFGSGPATPATPVIANGVAPAVRVSEETRARYRQTWGATPDDIVIGVIGRVSRRKGQVVFLDAAALVAKSEPRARFVVVGGPAPGQKGLVDALQARADRAPLRGRVVFSGYRDDVPALLAALDIAVVPSVLPESFGLAAAEAMAACKPVVASDLGGLAEVVVDDATGLLVPAGDANALAAALLRLVRDSALRERLGQAGRARVAQHYSLARYASEFATLYDRLLHPAQHAREQ